MRRNIYQLSQRYSLGLEDDSSGVASKEKEYVFYAKLSDPTALDKATRVEQQEQWSFKVPKTDKNTVEGRMRIRKTVVDSNVEYVLTMKTELKGPVASIDESNTSIAPPTQDMREVGLNASEDAFQMFKLMADNGMIKTRYVLPIEGSDMVFEVDRFVRSSGEGEWSTWVKIDLEVKGKLTVIPKLPEGFTEVIYNQKDQQTDEEKDLIWRLYEEVFLTKNPGAV